MKAKQINCIFDDKQLFDLGEPIAYITAEFPKKIKNLGEYYNHLFCPALEVIYLEPSSNKLIASAGAALSVVDVKCSGVWEDDLAQEIPLPFQCHIDPKAIKELAGKKVDFAVWEKDDHVITACETEGVTAQKQCHKDFKQHYWQIEMVPDQKFADVTLTIPRDEIADLRKFIKEHQGTTQNDRDTRKLGFSVDAQANRLLLKIYDNLILDTIAVMSIENFSCDMPPMHLNLDSANLAIGEDFTGDISLYTNARRIAFKGDHRISIMACHRTI